jgi:hypothetical protein
MPAAGEQGLDDGVDHRRLQTLGPATGACGSAGGAIGGLASSSVDAIAAKRTGRGTGRRYISGSWGGFG